MIKHNGLHAQELVVLWLLMIIKYIYMADLVQILLKTVINYKSINVVIFQWTLDSYKWNPIKIS